MGISRRNSSSACLRVAREEGEEGEDDDDATAKVEPEAMASARHGKTAKLHKAAEPEQR